MRTASPCPTSPSKPRPGKSIADQPERRGECRHIRGAHGVAVHGRGVEGRLGEVRGDVLGKHAAARLLQRHALGLERLEPLRHAGEGFSYGEERHAGSAAKGA